MSFGPSSTVKTAENNLSGTSNAALNTILPAATSGSNQSIAAGTNLLGLGNNFLNAGAGNVGSGTNFLNTVLNGNQANTSALLQPSIDQIRQGTSNTLNGISTLMPRGGGRSSALFGQSFAPQQQIQGLFNNARTNAATALPQIGLAQEGVGTNLFGQGANLYGIGSNYLNAGTGGLNAANSANSLLGNMGFQQQQLSNNMISGIGSGILGLATLPFGGGTAANGLLGLLGPH